MSVHLRVPWKTRETIKYADPLHAGRHPFQSYLLTLCVVSGLPLLVGRVAAGSIAAYLPPALAFAWGLSLCLGSVTALVGSHWRGDYANALTLERMGLLLAGSAGVAYATVIIFTAPLSAGLVSAGLCLGFGASCIVRARDIGKIIARAGERVSTPVAREGESDAAAAYRDQEDQP